MQTKLEQNHLNIVGTSNSMVHTFIEHEVDEGEEEEGGGGGEPKYKKPKRDCSAEEGVGPVGHSQRAVAVAEAEEKKAGERSGQRRKHQSSQNAFVEKRREEKRRDERHRLLLLLTD
ncbi:hypothetical protein AXG93_154s1590 [Marchantia polymorpha subsp. ruderalis]|uniref:Uncharacterized protein n=1 Tax=Marchantia polymorpha subsp. ruderalis TaxID=1480154 RepID=A0A176VL65_MARPO|nr:hypothetical protein AXG93_154s1590 [Marchantia polymorpha subsp. ruderalis]